MSKTNIVIGAVVSAKTRHQNNRQNVNVNIKPTDLNGEYLGKLVAKGEVRTELNRLGLNSVFYIRSWIHQETN